MKANKWLAPLTLLAGLMISGVTAYFSIYGLSKLFMDSLISGFIVFGVLEFGKLVSASWTYRNWKIAPRMLKSIMVVAIVTMMGLTSLGVFGYLSKSYTDKTAPVAAQKIDLTALDKQIQIQQDRIAQSKDTLDRLNRSLDKRQANDKNGSSIWILRQNKTTVEHLSKEISDAQSVIIDLEKQKATKEIATQSVSSDLGPLSFIAKSLFDDSQASLDKAVRYMIGLLVIVFDPLAIALLLAANFSFSNSENSSEKYIPDLPIPVNKTELQNYLGPKTIVETIPEQITDVDEVESNNE